jgi:hypothetical protein
MCFPPIFLAACESFAAKRKSIAGISLLPSYSCSLLWYIVNKMRILWIAAFAFLAIG